MTIYNSDGSEPEMCGNGIRCLARFVSDVDKDERGKKYNVSTLAGLIVRKYEKTVKWRWIWERRY